jgi:amidase
VAAGLSALDVGSDACGSIRMPAHCCGVFGLKPTEHRVSSAGHGAVPGYPFAMRHLVSYGPLARSVRDLRLALSLIEGPDPRLADVPPLAERTDPARPVDRERPLRLLWVEALDGVPADAATRATLRALAARLAAAGHAVEERQPALDAVEAMRLWGEINGAELAGTTGAAIAAAMRLAIGTRLGRSPITVGLRRGLGGSMRRYAEALERRDAVIAALDASLAGYDALLCPTAAVPAIPHQRTGAPVSVDGARAPYSLALGGHVAPFNLTGSPVVVVPAARSPEGLPIGVQLVGRRWDDAALLDAAERVAELVGWSEWPFA